MNPRTTKDRTLNPTPLARLGYPCLTDSSQYTPYTKTLLQHNIPWPLDALISRAKCADGVRMMREEAVLNHIEASSIRLSRRLCPKSPLDRWYVGPATRAMIISARGHRDHVGEQLHDGEERHETPESLEPDTVGEEVGPFFVVHDHHATTHHHDLRLLMDGTLKSWAVPKGVPDKLHVKRLAIQTEDHPISYGSFEGTIPEGEYGAGTVTIFDRGDLDVMNRTEGKIVFSIQGARLKGTYALIKFKNDENRKNWLLIRTE